MPLLDTLSTPPSRRFKKRYVFVSLIVSCFALYGAALVASSHASRSRRVSTSTAIAAGIPGANAAANVLDRWAAVAAYRDVEEFPLRGDDVRTLRRMKRTLREAALSGGLGVEAKAAAAAAAAALKEDIGEEGEKESMVSDLAVAGFEEERDEADGIEDSGSSSETPTNSVISMEGTGTQMTTTASSKDGVAAVASTTTTTTTTLRTKKLTKKKKKKVVGTGGKGMTATHSTTATWGERAGARHAVIMAAPGLKEYDVIMALASIAAHAPDCVVLLIVTSQQAVSLALRIETPDGGGSGSSGGDKPRLWLRMYDWDTLHERLSPFQKTLKPPIRRYAMYDFVLEDMMGEDAAPPAPVRIHTSDTKAAETGVLFSNLDDAHLLPPHGVLLSDARDMVFQSDPFPALWGFVSKGIVTGKDVAGEGTPSIPLPSDWRQSWADDAAIVVAGEARVATVGQDDWNRGWVSFCYYDLGEAMVNDLQIFCSGTTFGTPTGLRIYLNQGMGPATEACSVIDWEKGMDQGIHNVISHRYDVSQINGWRESAKKGGPFRPGGGKDPMMKNPLDFLNVIEDFQKKLKIHIAHAEDGIICTMALLLKRGVARDAEGNVLPKEGAQSKCAIVHQFDRVPELFNHYQKKWNKKGDGVPG